MNREIIEFTTEEAWLANRIKDLTSSDIPVLFGHGYQTYEQLMAEKMSGVRESRKGNERIDWGTALQDAIANEFARQNNWNIRKKDEYIRIPELRIGSSFDFAIINEDKEPDEQAFDGELLEIKTVDGLEYKNKWITNGFEIEATPYIELQVQHQLLVSGLQVAYIGALIGGNKGVLLRREANKEVQEAILIKAKKFWEEVDEER